MSCKGHCKFLVGARFVNIKNVDFLIEKYCKQCQYVIKTENIRCSCCGRKYTTRPRGAEGRRRLKTRRGVKYL